MRTTILLSWLVIQGGLGLLFAQENGAPMIPKPREPPHIELRAGPRFSALDGTVRSGGSRSVRLSLHDDLNVGDFDVSPQLDLDWSFVEKWHFGVSYTESHVQTQATTRDVLSYGGLLGGIQVPPTLLAGTVIETELDFRMLRLIVAYDAFKAGAFSLSPLAGAKGIQIDELTTIRGPVMGSTTIYHRDRVEEITPLVGFDSKVQLTRALAIGIAPVGFAYETYTYVGGQAYLDWQAHRNFGVRLGVDADHVDYPGRENGFSTSTTITALFLQLVTRF